MIEDEVITFYHSNEPYEEFSNFYTAPFVDRNGLRWETSEAFYQAHKFEHIPSYFHLIRFADHPRKAFLMGRLDVSNDMYGNQKVYEGSRYSVNQEIMRNCHFRMRQDWEFVKLAVMYEALTYKFTQNEHLKQKLLNTKNTCLEEASPIDYFWGSGADGTGSNWLGHLLETLRNELRAA